MEELISGNAIIRFSNSKITHEVYIKSMLIVGNNTYFNNTFSLRCSLQMIKDGINSNSIFITLNSKEKEMSYKIQQGQYAISENGYAILHFELG
jgi:hypothetical protein